MHEFYNHRSEIRMVISAEESLVRSMVNPGSIPGASFPIRSQHPDVMQYDGIRKKISRRFLCIFPKNQLKYAKGQVHPFSNKTEGAVCGHVPPSHTLPPHTGMFT